MKIVAPLIALAVLATNAQADWPSVQFNSNNNAYSTLSQNFAALDDPLAWKTLDNDLTSGIRPVVAGNTIVAVKMDDGGTSGFGETSDDSIVLRAYDKRTGYRIWESPELDAGDSVGNDSLSAPLIDGVTNGVYFASGTSMQKLSLADGSLIWSTTFGPENTDPNGAFGIANSSPAAFDNSLIAVQTSNFGVNPSQTVALNPDNGEVVWHYTNGGQGAFAPLIFQLPFSGIRGVFGPQFLCVVDTKTEEGAGLIALDLDNGELYWSHATVADPWVLSGGSFVGIWTEPITTIGEIYAVSYDFSADGELAVIDIFSGGLINKVSSVGTDIPPLYKEDTGELFLLGGAFGDAELEIYNALNITEAPSRVATGTGFFRNYMTGGREGVVFSQSGIGFTLRDTDGSILETAPSLTGPASVDEYGSLYAYQGGSLVRLFNQDNIGERDADQDGISEGLEAFRGLSDNDRDSDDDGWEDGVEVRLLSSNANDPNDPGNLPDADSDGLPDSVDNYPNSVDGNENGIRDLYEVIQFHDSRFPTRLGDTDGNGSIDNVDGVLAMEVFMGTRTDVLPFNKYFDVNRDGQIDNVDAMIIMNYFLGNIGLLPTE